MIGRMQLIHASGILFLFTACPTQQPASAQEPDARVPPKMAQPKTAVLWTAAFPPPQLHSDLNACANVSLKGTRVVGNLGLATLAIEFIKSVGDCGCKSALLLVRSVDRSGGEDLDLATEILSAPLRPRELRQVDLVVAGDVTVLPKTPVALHLGCLPPS